MRKSLFTVLLLLGVVLIFTSCSSDDGNDGGYVRNMLPPVKNMALTQEQAAQLQLTNGFAIDLLRETYAWHEAGDDKGKSMFMSPMGVTYMLGMLNSGASAAAQQEITHALKADGKSAEEINKLFQAVMKQAPEVDPSVELLTANAIYVNKDYELTGQFEDDMVKYYEADARSLDFSNPNTLRDINSWANAKTEGMIPEVMTDKDFDAGAACYLLNSIYFQATWTKQFDRAETAKKPFTKADGQVVQRDMMHNKAFVMGKNTDHSLMIKYGYGSNSWAMYIMLPHEEKTVKDVLVNMSTATLDGRWDGMELDLELPKFTTASNVNLKEVLPQMGITAIFGGGMTGICKDKELAVTKIFQKGKIDVDEEGTKATAVTVAEVGETSPGPTPGIDAFNGEFHANHPFVYIIREEKTGTIFFMGVYEGE